MRDQLGYGAHREVAVEKSEWARHACQVRGTAAEAAKFMGKQQAEADRKVWTSTGVRARQASRGKDPGSLLRQYWTKCYGSTP